MSETRPDRGLPFTVDGQEHLRMRLVGLLKAIDEEMQPGPREFCLAALADFSDAYQELKEENARMSAELALALEEKA